MRSTVSPSITFKSLALYSYILLNYFSVNCSVFFFFWSFIYQTYGFGLLSNGMLPENKRDRQVFGGFDKTYQVVENEAILSGAVDKEIAFS